MSEASPLELQPKLQRDADPVAPGPSQPDANGPVCRCGQGPHAERKGLCAWNHPFPGHGALLSTTHGLYSRPHDAIDAEGEQLLAQSIRDAGGPEAMIARALTAHRNRVHVQVNLDRLAAALNHHGLFDRRGRLRVAWITKLESLTATAIALDRLLGMDRRARSVNLQERLATAFAEKSEREGKAS